MAQSIPSQDYAVALAFWHDGVTFLGGTRATARALDIAERTVRAISSGERTLHQGYLADLRTALLRQADIATDLADRIGGVLRAVRAES